MVVSPSEFMAAVEEFFMTGMVVLAIVLATARAYIAKLLFAIESAGLSDFAFICLLSIVAVLVCLGARTSHLLMCLTEREQDEEVASEIDNRLFGRVGARSGIPGVIMEGGVWKVVAVKRDSRRQKGAPGGQRRAVHHVDPKRTDNVLRVELSREI